MLTGKSSIIEILTGKRSRGSRRPPWKKAESRRWPEEVPRAGAWIGGSGGRRRVAARAAEIGGRTSWLGSPEPSGYSGGGGETQ